MTSNVGGETTGRPPVFDANRTLWNVTGHDDEDGGAGLDDDDGDGDDGGAGLVDDDELLFYFILYKLTVPTLFGVIASPATA